MAIHYDSGEYIHKSALVTGAPFTFSCWAKFNPVPTAGLMSLTDVSQNDRDAFMLYWAGDYVYFFIKNGPSYIQTPTGLVYGGGWAHFAAVEVSSSSHHCYLDGVVRSSFNSRTPTGIDVYGIGCRKDASPDLFTVGEMADVALYNTALSSTEIASL